MKTSKIISLSMIVVCSCFVLALNSCKKPEPPRAIITVVDEAGQPVENAKVIILPPESGTLVYFAGGSKFSDETLTNSEGQVNYEFKYEAIYSIKVQKPKDRVITYDRIGTGVVILQENKTTEQKIKIRIGSI